MEISKRQLQENYNPSDFNNIPELSQIGTEEQYSAYLDTIFPSSKINQIMYHKTSAEKFDEFKVSRLGGVYFSFFDVPTRAGFIGKMIAKLTKERMVLAKVNVINPFIINRNNYKDIEKKTGGATQSVTELGKKYDLSGYDSILGYPNPLYDKGELDKFPQINFIEGRRKDLIELAVFNTKNIHILGSKQDIEGFRNFVNNTDMEITKRQLQENLNNVIYTAVFFNTNEVVSKYEQVHPNLYSHHSTIEFKPTDVSNLPIGKEINIEVIGRLTNDKVDVLVVKNTLSKNKFPHITLSTAEGIKPFQSNTEIENNKDKIKPINDNLIGIVGYFDGRNEVTEKQTQLEGMEISKKDLEEGNFMEEITKGELEEAKKARTNLSKKKKDDRCTRIAKSKYNVWPSAYSSGAVVRCRQGKIWKDLKEEEEESLDERWSEKYKRSIDCNNSKGFSQKAHCKGRLKESKELFQNKALDKLSKVGGFELLSDIDKLALLGGSNDERLKYLDLGNIFKQNGGTFGKLEIKVKIKDKNLQPIKHKFSQEFAGKEGYLFPYINYDDENQGYVILRFDEFVTNPNNFGGGNYEERPIMLANLYPIDYDKIKSNFVDYQNKTDFERDEFRKDFADDDDLFESLDEKTDFSKEKKQGLHGWFARQGGKGKSKGWVDCNTCRDGKCKSCGRKEGEKRSKYPACRPTPSACKTKGKGKSWGKKSKLNEDNQYLRPEEINEILKGYIETALWTEEERLEDDYNQYHKGSDFSDDYEDDDELSELDKLVKLTNSLNQKTFQNFTREDIEPDSLIKAYSDIKIFIQLAGDSVYEAIYENGLERLGTDIWFTRNGHGAGFFDHSYDDDDEKKLIQAGKSLGSVDLYINDNLKLSFSNQHLHEQSKQDIEREIKLNEIKSLFKRHIGKL